MFIRTDFEGRSLSTRRDIVNLGPTDFNEFR